MTKEVSCHLLSNKPFICSLKSIDFLSEAEIPGSNALTKITECVKVYLKIVRQMYLRSRSNNHVKLLIINDN